MLHRAFAREQWLLARVLFFASGLFGVRDSWYFEVKGRLASERGDQEAAVRHLRKAVELDVENLRTANVLLEFLIVAENIVEASILAKNLQWRQGLSTANGYDLGVLLLEHGEHQQAIAWFENSLRQACWKERSQLCIAHCLLNLGRSEDAADSYESLARKTNDPRIETHARIGLAKALFDCGDLAGARAEAFALSKDMTGPDADEAGVRGYIDELLAWLDVDRHE